MSELLTVEEIRLLSTLAQTDSLAKLSEKWGRDKSVVSRKLASIAQKSPALEKVGTRWRLTEQGTWLSKLAIDFDEDQKRILGQPSRLAISASRMFTTCFLSSRTDELRTLFPNTKLFLHSFEDAPEELLLKGSVDIAFACGRPQDPAIAFKKSILEPFFAVCSSQFAKKNSIRDFSDLSATPHVAYVCSAGTLPFQKFLSESTPVVVSSNDPLAVLEAVEAGIGWSVLPYYTLEKSVLLKKLRIYKSEWEEKEQFGVWWLRSRKNTAVQAKKAAEWLGKQRLEPSSVH